MNKILLFCLLILVLDVPFITWVMAPKYKAIGLAKNPKLIFALCAYIVMTLSWFLIKGDLFKAALTGLSIYGTYAFTLATVLDTYKLPLALTEIIWGTSLYTFATYLTNRLI